MEVIRDYKMLIVGLDVVNIVFGSCRWCRYS